MPEPTRVVPLDGIRAGRNESGSTILENFIVKLGTVGDPNLIVLAAAGTDTLYGVAEEDIEDLSNGDVQVRGKAIVISSAAITIGAQITSDAVGKGIVTTTAGNSVLGVAVTTTAGADELFEVELIGPGGGNL